MESPVELPPLCELEGEGAPWLYSTLWGVGVEARGTSSDGSGRKARWSKQKSLKTKIKLWE